MGITVYRHKDIIWNCQNWNAKGVGINGIQELGICLRFVLSVIRLIGIGKEYENETIYKI
jgi:hypothetical protein